MVSSFRFKYAWLFLSFLILPQGLFAQDEIEKIKLDPNKTLIKGEHRIPSPKTQKTVPAAKIEISPVAFHAGESETKPNSAVQIAAGNNEHIASSAERLNATARRESLKKRIAAKPLTEIYRVGVGDVLDVRLLNSPAKDSTLYTVLAGGLLDYPLAGEPIAVDNLTTEEIAELLMEKIKLYEQPDVVVSIRDFASHQIVISGLIEKPGEKIIRREAVPLFTVLAEAVQFPEAAKAVVIRANKEVLEVDLKELAADVLVYHGDFIKISAAEIAKKEPNQFYFIAGSVAAPGQKEFHSGLTLTQAIFAAGGIGKFKTAIIFRQNQKNLLDQIQIDLKQIKNGKMPDVLLENGDRIEVR